MEIITQLVLVCLLILLSAFFSASEYAIVALRSTRVDELVKRGDALAKMIRSALSRREDFISATQLGTTIVSLILGWIGEPVFEKFFFSIFSFLPKGGILTIAHLFSITVSFLLLTFLSMIIGELVPKTIAIQRAEIVALILIAPLTMFTKIFHPLVFFLNKIANKTLLILGLNSVKDYTTLSYSKEELKLLFNQISDSGIMAKEELSIVDNVFRLSEKQIKLMMTPRTEILMVNINLPISRIREQLDPRFSRFPVYKGDVDNIIGFIHVKDVYHLLKGPNKEKKLSETSIIRKIISVPETKKANEVLLDMKKKHVHVAVVYDEFGVMVGLVSLEDIIESLVGDIQDEFDKPILNIKRNSDGSYLIDGNVSLEKMQKRFHLPIKGQGYTTIGGLIFGLIGREPRIGDKIWISHKSFEVKSVEGKRIKELVLRMNGLQNDSEKR